MTCRTRERILGDLDSWESGFFESPGCPYDGQNYSLRMREARKVLESELRAHITSCLAPECIRDCEYWKVERPMSDPSALTAILVPAERQAEIQSEQSEAWATVAQLREWPCVTPEDEQDLADILGAIKAKSKALEEKRTTITGPLNLAKRAVDALFRPAKDALEEAETIIKGKLAEADRRREEARKAAQRQLQEAARAQAALVSAGGTLDPAPIKAAQAALAATPTPGSAAAPEGVHFRYVWKWELEDIGQVPTEFLALNPATMKIYTSRYKDQEDIPQVSGLRFFRERIVVAREG